MKRDISTNYGIGDRYITLDKICSKFMVCRQTGNKGVKQLVSEKILTSSRGQGIRVTGQDQSLEVAGKKLLVYSRTRHHQPTNEAFLKGVRQAAEPRGVNVSFLLVETDDTQSLDFGKHLVSLDADGIIALDFPVSPLPFYYAITHGMDIVAEIDLPELPIRP